MLCLHCKINAATTLSILSQFQNCCVYIAKSMQLQQVATFSQGKILLYSLLSFQKPLNRIAKIAIIL